MHLRGPGSCGIIRPGQRQEAALGLYDYGARFYDPALGRFISADTVVPNPDNPQSFNRYSYVLNNPLRYVDPTGHDENDFYVFVQGGGEWTDFWKHFLDELRKQFGNKIGDGSDEAWDNWVKSHVAYKNYATTGNVEWNAQDFSNWLQNNEKIQKFSGGGIHLVGHSMGGLVVIEYLRGLAHRTSGVSAPKQGIKSAAILDSPLDAVGSWVGFRRYEEEPGSPIGEFEGYPVYRDRLAGLGTWAKDYKIVVVTVSYDPSQCDHRQVDTIPHWSIPWKWGRPFLPGPAHSYVVDEPVDSGSFKFLWDRGALR